MKKGFISLLLCLVLVTSFSSPAAANSWGLKGDLYDAVSDVDTWNDYHTLDGQVGDAAVMHSRYHNTLMLVEDGRLRTFSTAVYQPDDKRDDELILNGSKKDFVLNYGDDEWYSFNNLGSGWYLVGTLTDTSGCVGYTESPSSTITRGYNASDSTGSALIPYGIPLSEFNIQLFPRTVQEIRHLNQMHAALNSGADILNWWADDEDVGQKKSNAGKRTTPVYSAPFGKSAWRAAKGKASVGLSGDLWVLRYVTNADGEHYACIRYEVSERTQRIGYIPAEVLGEEALGEPSEDFIHVPVYASRETYLTDDPLCSQFPQFKVPAGTQFECLGMFNRWYAYVTAEVKDVRFVDGGEIVWGFVPLRDLALDADTHGNTLIGFYIGTGLGNAICMAGTILSGKNGVAGEAGHVPVIGAKEPCGCGKTGCLETLASGRYLEKLQKAYFPSEPLSSLFVRQAQHEVLQEYVDILAIAVAMEVNILDPNYVILGGGVLQMESFPMEQLKQRIRHHSRKPYPANNLTILNSRQKQQSGVIGAAIYAYNQLAGCKD